jgi:heme/copper-type cytochrome/quinol oxidase subunit 3
MHVRPVLDVSDLELEAYGRSDTLWWGVTGLIIAEALGFALLIASYFYLRMRYTEWPPADAGLPSLNLSVANLLLIVSVCWPMRVIGRGAPDRSRFWLAGMLALTAVLIAGTCVLRIFEFQTLQTGWNEHSYGSITWALLFMHAVHLFTSLGEAIMLGVYCATSELDRKHRADLQINSNYWYFVAGAWVVVFAVVYLAGRVL